MIDWSFGVSDLITIALVIVAAASAFAFQRYSIEAIRQRADEAFILAKNSRDDLSAFRLLVAEKYIRAESLDTMEKRMVASEARMAEKIEALIKRIDALFDRMDRRQT